jgi:hypothetical protein
MKTKTFPAETCEYCLAPLPMPVKAECESEKDYADRKTKAILSNHGLDPIAIGGRHRILHTLSFQGEASIPCRCDNAQVDVAHYAWTGAYEKAQPAQNFGGATRE